jgi:hypothetical protein
MACYDATAQQQVLLSPKFRGEVFSYFHSITVNCHGSMQNWLFGLPGQILCEQSPSCHCLAIFDLGEFGVFIGRIVPLSQGHDHKFSSCDDPWQEGYLMKLLRDVETLMFLISCQDPGCRFGGDAMHAQFSSQNSLSCTNQLWSHQYGLEWFSINPHEWAVEVWLQLLGVMELMSLPMHWLSSVLMYSSCFLPRMLA